MHSCNVTEDICLMSYFFGMLMQRVFSRMAGLETTEAETELESDGEMVRRAQKISFISDA